MCRISMIGKSNGCDECVHYLKGKTGVIPAQSRYCNGELTAKMPLGDWEGAVML